jgi:hypothetical protein
MVHNEDQKRLKKKYNDMLDTLSEDFEREDFPKVSSPEKYRDEIQNAI